MGATPARTRSRARVAAARTRALAQAFSWFISRPISEMNRGRVSMRAHLRAAYSRHKKRREMRGELARRD